MKINHEAVYVGMSRGLAVGLWGVAVALLLRGAYIPAIFFLWYGTVEMRLSHAMAWCKWTSNLYDEMIKAREILNGGDGK